MELKKVSTELKLMELIGKNRKNYWEPQREELYILEGYNLRITHYCTNFNETKCMCNIERVNHSECFYRNEPCEKFKWREFRKTLC